MKWLTGFHTALRTGKLEEFTGNDLVDQSGFMDLSQVSSVGSITASQLSFAEPSQCYLSKVEPILDNVFSPPMPKVDAADDAVSSTQTPIVFASPSKRRGLTRRAEKKIESKKEMGQAKRIMTPVAEGRKLRTVKLAHMTILSGPYSFSTAKPLVDKLNLPCVEITEALEIRRFNIGQPVPVITSIPQLEKLQQAITAMNTKEHHELLARWGDYGCATYGQLKLMENVVTARNRFRLVEATVEWVDKVTFEVDSIVEPFRNKLDITKEEHKQADKDLNLGLCYVGRHSQYGVEFIDFRENLWLHSSTIIGGLLALRETYEGVGVVNPRFHEFDDVEQKLRTARGFGAGKPGLKRILSVINVSNHWAAFFVDITAKTCFLFDPMQLTSNITAVKEEVLNVVEKMLGMTDQLHY